MNKSDELPPGFGNLVERIYSAAVEPAGWVALVPGLATFLECRSALVQTRHIDQITLLGVTSNIDESAAGAYVEHFGKIDPWAKAWRQRGGRGGLLLGSHIIRDDVLSRTEFYQDYVRHMGIFHLLGAAIPIGAERDLTIGLHRPITATDFDQSNEQRLRILLPHLQRAVGICAALARADMRANAATDALDRLALGLAIVGADGSVIFANRAAERIFRDGSALGAKGGRLRAHDSHGQTALLEMLRRATAAARGQAAAVADVLALPRAGRPNLSVLVAPLPASPMALAFAGAQAAVFIHDPETARRPSRSALATLFGLSKAETRLLAALLEGTRLADYADQAGISVESAKVQLKSAFAKTGTGRQADLLRLAAGNPIATLAAPAHEDPGA